MLLRRIPLLANIDVPYNILLGKLRRCSRGFWKASRTTTLECRIFALTLAVSAGRTRELYSRFPFRETLLLYFSLPSFFFSFLFFLSTKIENRYSWSSLSDGTRQPPKIAWVTSWKKKKKKRGEKRKKQGITRDRRRVSSGFSKSFGAISSPSATANCGHIFGITGNSFAEFLC